MKKRLTFILFISLFLIQGIKSQITIPTPVLKYDFNAITSGSQVTPTVGAVVATITDGNSAAKTDASIVDDATRGSVLYLPNDHLDNAAPANKGDAAPRYRCLRISDAAGLMGSGDFTLSFWMKTNTQPATFNGFPQVMILDGMSSGRAFQFRNGWNAGKPQVQFNDGTTKNIQPTITSDSYMYDWTHYVFVKRGSENKLYLYINGTVAGSSSYVMANSEFKNLRFNGAAYGGGSLLDEIQIFHTALTSEQIGYMYSPTASISTSVYPADAGLSTGANASADIGSDITLTATANPGYTFAYWTENGNVVSTEAEYTFNVLANKTLTAFFKPANTTDVPSPFLKYEFDAITNSNEVEPTIGDITATITDGNSVLQNDASIEVDASKGNTLYLPNLLDGNNAGDAAGYYRSLRVSSDASLVGAGDFTISLWMKVKPQTNGLNGFPQIMTFDGVGFQLRILSAWNGNDKPGMIVDGKYINPDIITADYAYDWAHYAIVKEEKELKLYINGVFQASDINYTLPNTGLKTVRFCGSSHGGGALFEDIQIFHSALNDIQIGKLFNPVTQLQIDATGYPAVGGSVVGAGSFPLGDQVTLTATANAGYDFAYWCENGLFLSSDEDYVFNAATDRNIYAYFKSQTPETVPSLKIEGDNYAIADFALGEVVFSNRSYTFDVVPDDFSGYQFTTIDGNASLATPPTTPVMKITPESNGPVYVWVGAVENPEIISKWATDNGWELVPVYAASFGVEDTRRLSLFKKAGIQGTEIDIVQPAVFTGAMVVAPQITIKNLTGVSQVAQAEVSFYPNVVKDMIYFNNQEANVTKVEIYNLAGLKVMDELCDRNELNLDKLSSGYYIIKLNGCVSGKFIKL